MADVTNQPGITVTANAPAPTATVGAFNISNFRAQIDSFGGIMKNNLFRVEITPPSFLSSTGITNQILTFYCEATNLPGVRINTTDIRRYGVGPREKMPVNHSFDDLNLNIIADSQGYMLRFFRDWTRGIVEYVTEGSMDSPPDQVPNRAMNAIPYYMNYKQNYEAQVTVVVFDATGQTEAFSLSLLHAFPTDVGDISLGWGQTDQLMTIPIRFSFMDVAYTDPNPGAASPQATGLSLFQTFEKGVTAAQAIIPILQKPTNLGGLINQVTTTSNVLGNLFGSL
jgi:hypothetical protein